MPRTRTVDRNTERLARTSEDYRVSFVIIPRAEGEFDYAPPLRDTAMSFGVRIFYSDNPNDYSNGNAVFMTVPEALQLARRIHDAAIESTTLPSMRLR